MELLLGIKDRGYPSEYLVSRIRGKRAGLISDWSPLYFNGTPTEFLASSQYRGFVTDRSPEGVWRDLRREYRRIYSLMNKKLRNIFRPFFLYSELRTILISLRHIEGKKGERNDDILLSSLLSAEIKKVLRESGDVATAVREIERCFLSLSAGFAGIAGIYAGEGLKGFEKEFTSRYLLLTAKGKLHPLMKEFFVRIIDARNIISLDKYIRLTSKTAPSLIPCGSINGPAFAGIIAKKDLAALIRLAGTTDEGAGRIEQALYRKITGFLRKAGRDPLGIGPILDYLWRISLEVVNLSILYYGRDIDSETVRKELVP
jgi:vacuolar-type H+-ATPase subunit C/Vma6